MQIKDYRCKCGCNDFFFLDKCNQKGIYCTDCGRWFKWADKDEQNLAMKQEPILDKLRAEIAEHGSIWVEYKITGNSNRDIEKLVSDVLSQAKKQVLDVIDKYKAESEG